MTKILLLLIMTALIEALGDFCDEMGCTFIDDTFLVDESMYEPDGEHMVYNYYPKWLTYMAERAGLV